MSTSTYHCRLPLPENYRISDILSFHGRDKWDVAETVYDNYFSKGIIWHDTPACLSIRFQPLYVEIELCIDKQLKTFCPDTFHSMAIRMLGLNQSVNTFEEEFREHAQLGSLIAKQSGLRVPVSATAFEALIWAITGQKISVSAALAIRRKLIQLIGLRHSGGLYCHPNAQHLSHLSISDLRQIGFSHSKAQTILTVSQRVICNELELSSASAEPPIEHIRQQLLQIRGIGLWTVDYTLLRGYGWLDGSLHGDVAVRRGLQILLNCESINENQTRQWLENFSPWRALVAAHLWNIEKASCFGNITNRATEIPIKPAF